MIVKFAYFLNNSVRYQKTKACFYDLLENPNGKYNGYVAFFIIAMVLLSVFFLIREINHEINALSKILEQSILVIFTIEYLLRFWLASDSHKIVIEHYEKAQYLNRRFELFKTLANVIHVKIRYMITPMAIIDLLAILPSYETFRFLRVFMVFRLLKLFRHFHSIKVFINILANKRFELYTLGIFLGFLIFIGSTVIYLFESHSEGGQIKTLFDGFYWTIVTLSTVGYGDISPHSIGGRLVAIVLIFSGIGVLSFFTSIMVSGFSEEIDHLRENRAYTEIDRYKDFVILCGFGRVGQHIAKQLFKDKLNFIVIDSLEQNFLKAQELGYMALQEDASKNGILEKARINNGASSILCATDDDVINVYITLTARNLNQNVHISRANNVDNVKKMYQAGANNVIRPFEIAGMVVAEYVGQPVAFEAILGIIHAKSDIVMETLEVKTTSLLECIEIANIDFLKRKLILLGVISSNSKHSIHQNNSYEMNNQHFYFNPPESFLLQANDMLVVLGRKISIEYFRSQIEKSCLIKTK